MGQKEAKVSRVSSINNRINTCFGKNDVRCVYGKELDEEIAYRTARAIISFLKCKKIVLGYDMRVSSPSLKRKFAQGLTDSGADVIDIGRVDSPGTYFASGYFKMPAAMITASHNPAKYNGIKLVRANAEPIGEKTGLIDIKALVLTQKFIKSKKKGKIIKKNIFKPYIKHVRSFVDLKKLKSFKVVMDAGNGMASLLVPKVYKNLPIKIIKQDFKLSGNFPNHVADPSKHKNIHDLEVRVKKEKADFGISYDGDIDRIFFVDEKGKRVDSSLIAALLIKEILKKKKGSIVYNVAMSKIVPDTIKKYKGKAIKERVGHAFIKYRMKKTKSLFACENSAHYYYKENFYADSGLITSLIVCEMFSQSGKKFSEMLDEFRKYSKSEEKSLKVEDKDAMIKKIESKYKSKAKKIEKLDGLTMIFNNYGFNVRRSNTEPLLRVNIESLDERTMIKRRKELLDFIKMASK